MTSHWDEFSKSLAEASLPRRESLRRLGFLFAGAVLSPLGLQSAATGNHPKQQQDLCKSFGRCRTKKQQDQCLKACNACARNPSRLGGSCGSYYCCGAGQTSCGGYCTELGSDPSNCGACGHACDDVGPWEYGVCIDGQCEYACAQGAVYCNGICTFLNNDSFNCGACGNVCGESTPYCSWGQCWDANCGGANLDWDPNNCGRCGHVCPPGFGCSFGVCGSPCVDC